MILEYNLQFFAKDGPGGEKTEPATAKKLADERKKGHVAKSKEVNNAFGLLTSFLLFKFWMENMGTSLVNMFRLVYDDIPEYIKMYDGRVSLITFSSLFKNVLLRILIMLAPFLAIGFIVSFICDVVQVKWKPTGKPLKPNFKKLNPISGFKKFFSPTALVELVKAILKIGIIGWVCYSYLRKNVNGIFTLYDMTLNSAIVLVGSLLINMGIRVSCAYLIIAFADYIYQKWKFKDDMKMTKQEVKDEYKNSEGNPEIKGKIRQKMREVSQRRMMQNLPKADVVITNPTHYAVAIQYDSDNYDAPIVLAKGEDYLALKIKEVAKEHDIEIVENKPLARMLYANVEVGEMIPPELYQSVAEVLAFVYKLKGKV